MTLKECLNFICERQIPKEINGLRTKYVIEEYKNYFGTPCTELAILPTECRADVIGVTIKLENSFYIDYDYAEDSIGFRECRRMIEEALCRYINNIIIYFNGEVFDRETFLGKENNICLFTPSPFKPKKRLRGDCIFYSDERTQDGRLTFCAHQNKYGIDNCVGCDGYISNEDHRYAEGLKELIEKLRSEENE